VERILLVDQVKCTGCRLCEMVCSVRHTGSNSPSRSRVHVVKWPQEGFDLPVLCPQCDDAPCVAVCPTDALAWDPIMSRVALDYNLCIGCKMCVAACPLGGMGIDTVARKVVKCDLCDGDPTCVRFCESGALQFVPASSVNLRKKREACERLSQVIRKPSALKR
jgi:carbon-monoxide dehydrogenase iron sulfur subunit